MARPQPRSKLYSIGAVSLAVGITLFLLLAPAVEREAYLAQIESGDSDSLESAVLHLCWIAPGREGMHATLMKMEPEPRLAVLEEAKAQGCLELLHPELQAAHAAGLEPPEAADAEEPVQDDEPVEPEMIARAVSTAEETVVDAVESSAEVDAQPPLDVDTPRLRLRPPTLGAETGGVLYRAEEASGKKPQNQKDEAVELAPPPKRESAPVEDTPDGGTP